VYETKNQCSDHQQSKDLVKYRLYITDDILAIPRYNVIIRKDRAGIGKGLGGGIILYHKDLVTDSSVCRYSTRLYSTDSITNHYRIYRRWGINCEVSWFVYNIYQPIHGDDTTNNVCINFTDKFFTMPKECIPLKTILLTTSVLTLLIRSLLYLKNVYLLRRHYRLKRYTFFSYSKERISKVNTDVVSSVVLRGIHSLGIVKNLSVKFTDAFFTIPKECIPLKTILLTTSVLTLLISSLLYLKNVYLLRRYY
jgi:hypothetical protein